MSALLTAEDIERELVDLPGWAREGEVLARTWETKGFGGAMQLANVVAYVANRFNHHPDILVHSYNRVRVTITTHDSGGITHRDVEFARKVNATLEEAG